jgi:hypothetical protein
VTETYISLPARWISSVTGPLQAVVNSGELLEALALPWLHAANARDRTHSVAGRVLVLDETK